MTSKWVINTDGAIFGTRAEAPSVTVEHQYHFTGADIRKIGEDSGLQITPAPANNHMMILQDVVIQKLAGAHSTVTATEMQVRVENSEGAVVALFDPSFLGEDAAAIYVVEAQTTDSGSSSINFGQDHPLVLHATTSIAGDGGDLIVTVHYIEGLTD